MKQKQQFFALLMTTVHVLVFGVSAHGAILVDAGPSSVLQGWVAADFTLGSEFTVVAPGGIEINHLGYLDAEGDGLEGSHMVGLWRVSDQALLASANVTPTSVVHGSAHGTAQWYFESIGGTISLAPGAYRVGGLLGTTDLNALSDDQLGIVGTTVGSSGYVLSAVNPPSGFAYPVNTLTSNAIRVTVANIPDPSSAGLFGLLAIAGILNRRRGRQYTHG